MLKIQPAEAWAGAQVAGLPVRWRGRIYKKWQGSITAAETIPSGRGLVTAATQAANIALADIVAQLEVVRLPLDAQDSDICARADECAQIAMDVGRVQVGIKAVRAGMAVMVRGYGLDAPDEKISDRGAISRMTCGDWWRRGLRKLHAKAVEGAAIQLGYVNRQRDIYISNESMARRAQQNRRNALMLENTIMQNDEGQQFTLAELAAKGTANKAIRRGELMTRIAGFEKIAVESGHGGLFLTLTCPSRMHKWISAGGKKVFENLKYDGTTPRQAQAYLSKCYARTRAALARKGAHIYGFRIAEPHHDGCPHWHILIFHKRGFLRRIVRTFKKYFIADSASEAGALKHRVKAEVIDWRRGTAAGYIAKYIAKNIDGLRVGEDLYGNPAMETSSRVEAWASTWGIKQFQQVGGAPVGVWRELRRIKAIPEGAPAHLRAAHDAVNKTEGVGDGEGHKADWAGYVKAQGGVFIGRDSAIKIATKNSAEIGRYGEPIGARPIGVSTTGAEVLRGCVEVVHWVVESARRVWQVVRRGLKARLYRALGLV